MALTRTPQTDSKTKLGRYELLRELAASSVGTSWLARPTGETFEVTLFKVHRHMAKAPSAVETLMSGAQTARKFAHDNVAGVLDAGVVDGEPFIVNEYVGESLASLLRAAGPAGLPIPIALRISLDILEGFAAAHTHDPPIGHGELGPWCVYVGSDGVARVGGFGVDQAVWRFGAHYVKNMERLSYAAPERVKSMSSTLGQELGVADEQSDLFSAAVLVFELLTRQKLFASKMEAAVVQKVLTSPIPTAQSFRPEVPLEVSDALKQALVRDRSERLDSFEDFIVALEGAGPELIASNEAVAEMVNLATSEKSVQEKRSIPPPPTFLGNGGGGAREIASSAGTPGAATKRAPVPGRATLMFDEVKGLGFTPKPPAAALSPATAVAEPFAAAPVAAAPVAAEPVAAAPVAAAPVAAEPVAAAAPVAGTPRTANGTGAPMNPRAKTLMGFGALRVGAATKESPLAPPVVPILENVAPPISGGGNPRSSSVELDDSDFDVEIEDPLSMPTTVVELPSTAPKKEEPLAARVAAEVPHQAPAAGAVAPGPAAKQAVVPATQAVKAPHRRTATLLGIQAPEKLAAPAKNGAPKGAQIDDEETTRIDDEGTSVDEPSAALMAAATPSPAAPSDKLSGLARKVQALQAKESEGTPATGPSPGSDGARGPGKRSLFTNEMLRTGAVLGVTGKEFELIAPVARGGMATVWAAREVGSKGLEKMVAIKTMLPELSDDVEFESMFLDEGRVAAKIRHINVASIIDLGQEDSLLYLAMEWVDGETVGTIQRSARASGGIPTAIAVRIAADICAGLHEAHELCDDAGHFLEVVHRDISPANVLVSREGNAKIVDFGIAKSKGRLHVTKVGAMVKGKTPYLSPEQIGGLAIDRRSDLFSLGALLYVMATGLHPFRGETELSTIENIAIKAPVPIRNIVPDIDPGFEKIVLKLLEKDPKKRFQTAREVREALEHLEGAAAPAPLADVATFVAKVVGDKLDQRRQMLHGGLERMEGKQASTDVLVTAPIAPTIGEATPASALQQVLERVRQSQPELLSGISFADPAQPSIAKPTSTGPAIGDPPNQGVSSERFSGEGPPSSGEVSSADVAGASPPQEYSEDSIEAPPRSNTKRLFVLIAAGLLIGLAIVGSLEAFRGPSATPSASVSAQPTATPPAPVARSAVPPSKTTAEPTATVTSEPTAVPSGEPAAVPTTTAGVTPQAPGTATPKLPPGKLPVPGTKPTGHPPGWGKLPKPKYNPPTI